MFEVKHKKTQEVLVQFEDDSLEGRKMSGARLRAPTLRE